MLSMFIKLYNNIVSILINASFLFLLTGSSYVLSYSCDSYYDPTTCVTTEHILCAYCVDIQMCGEYNPCEQNFVNINYQCQDIIINSNVTQYLETCGIMTIGDYCTIIFILLAIICMIYIIISNKYIKTKYEELEKPLNVIFITLCSMIIIALTVIFTIYRIVLSNVSQYYDNLYVVLKYLSIIITVILILIILSVIVVIISFSICGYIIDKTKDTWIHDYVEKIKIKLPCLKINKRRNIFEDTYENEYLTN